MKTSNIIISLLALFFFIFIDNTHPESKLLNNMEIAWIQHYASGLLPGIGDDVATAMIVDGTGNVFVTGYSSNLPFYLDYYTIKYNASGEQIWAVRYNGPGNADDRATALAVDNAGNVYVTGYSQGLASGDDYTTIKYNAAGEEQWVARYNSLESFDDKATALTVDNTGNIYVTGRSYDSGTGDDYVTVKYDSSGKEQWIVRYNGTGNF